MDGFFNLKTISDLLEKLERDFERLSEEPLNVDAAFNFFVTANCMPDWLYPDLKGPENKEQRTTAKDNRESLKNKNTYLKICDHIASGAKHLTATANHHESVADTKKQGNWGPHFSNPTWFNAKWGFQGRLDIILDGDAHKEIGESISSLQLASKIIDYWRDKLHEPIESDSLI